VKKLFALLLLGGLLGLAACQNVPTAPKVTVKAPEPQPLPYRWTHGHSAKSYEALKTTFKRAWLNPGDYVWAEDMPKEGDPRIIIDLLTQTAYAYRGDVLVGAASISSAKTGKVTPLGFWKVLEKKKFHRSRKYNNAPMPFMQRIDEYGIALHGGPNPGFPASQGCVRMPMKFAEKLYGLTKIGTEIVIEG
jgi:hypothetical protein